MQTLYHNSPFLDNVNMSAMIRDPMMALCQTNGKIIAANQALFSFYRSLESGDGQEATLITLAHEIECDELRNRFEHFVIAEKGSEKFLLSCKGREYHVRLQKLDNSLRQSLIVVELKEREYDDEEKVLLEVGRMTSRLIHDFKNQMGGLKLYAAYLKKRFAANPEGLAEGLEIADKIIQGLNAMAEQAALVSKLTRPLELNREKNDLVALINQVLQDLGARAVAQSVKIESELGIGLPAVSFDSQQLRTALSSILARAVDASAEGGRVRVELRSQPGEALIEIADQGEGVGEQQRQAIFNFLGNDRINKTSLDLALARRIIEEHGGLINALAPPTGGTVVQVILPI